MLKIKCRLIRTRFADVEAVGRVDHLNVFVELERRRRVVVVLLQLVAKWRLHVDGIRPEQQTCRITR